MSTPNKKAEAARAVLDDLENMGGLDGSLSETVISAAGQKVVIERDNPLEQDEIAAKLWSLRLDNTWSSDPQQGSSCHRCWFLDDLMAGVAIYDCMPRNFGLLYLTQK